VSSAIATGFVDRTVPARCAARRHRELVARRRSVRGLDHLEGKSLAVTADGVVVASPNNPANPVACVVVDGAITLDKPYSRIRAGLPYLSDLETLDIDTPSGPSLKDRRMLVNQVTVYLEASRGAFVGQSLPPDATPVADMNELKLRDEQDASVRWRS
jgi:hypothetical protein